MKIFRKSDFVVSLLAVIIMSMSAPIKIQAEDMPEFYYEQEMEDGSRLVVSAKAGILPENAEVTVTRQSTYTPIEKDVRDEVRSVYDMYGDVDIQYVENYSYEVSITYVDNKGKTIEIDKNEDIRITYEPADDERDPMERVISNEAVQSIDDVLVYSVEVTSFPMSANKEAVSALEKAWDLIQTYSDTTLLYDPFLSYMTEEEYDELKAVAEEVTKDCKTQYEKIEAINKYVAERVYYDYEYYYGETDYVFYEPYDVWYYQKSVCAGYTSLMTTLYTSIGIPSMEVFGEDHVYNIVYDSDNDEWIFADSTWCSNNIYTADGEWISGSYTDTFFDTDIEVLASVNCHEMYNPGYFLVDGLYYQLDTGVVGFIADGVDWTQMENWSIALSGIKNGTELVVKDELGDIQVRSVAPTAFTANENITSVDMSNSYIEDIKYDAFYGCCNLEEVIFSPYIKNIGECAFAYSNIDELELSYTGIKTIGDAAFTGCDGLKEVDLSKTLIESIGYCSFFDCNYIEVVKLPGTLTSLGDSAFEVYETEEIRTQLYTDLSDFVLRFYDAATSYTWSGRDVVKFPLQVEPGWMNVAEEWYFFDEEEVMQTGWIEDEGTWYYLNEDGVMGTEWQEINGRWYYLGYSGAMQTGWQYVGGRWYYLLGSGAMETGWLFTGGCWYYLSGSGAMVTGWQEVNDTWYYFSGSGAMETGWQLTGDRWYYLSGSGAMVTGWQEINGIWYYFSGSGAMVTGWQLIEGAVYYFNLSGAWVE